MKTFYLKPGERKLSYHLIDADAQVLGRLAVKIAGILIGKNRVDYTPHVLSGDGVIVINAKGVRLTGNKEKQKIYRHYTGYPGGLREITFEKMRATHPEKIVMEAVRKMLPKNLLGVKMLKRLRVYAGSEYRQQAQKPIAVKLGGK